MLVARLIIVSFAVGYCASNESPSVTTQIGRITGHFKYSFGRKKYEAYDGIPYALPPTGERRFEPPVPTPPSTNNVIVANKFRQECLQYDRERPPGYIYGTEDCLYLNVYAPLRSNASYPVIFDIHGGAFQYGITFENGGYYLIDRDVILVTLHYRLGLFGFLSTEDEVVPGNMGLKDQSIALKWVHENIQHFGGDPKRITLTGLSAGGASVHYHYLSPMSRGLFHSGISYSGTALDCWTQTERSREKAIEVAGMVKCPKNDTRAMIQCLKQRPAEELVALHPRFMPWKLNPFTPFGPVVEKSTTNHTFIDRSPIDIIISGDVYDVPWVTGIVSEEGLYPVAEFITDAELKEVNDNWETIAPYLLDYNYTIPKAEHANVARKIRKHYFKDESINKTSLHTLIRLVSDRIFDVDAEKAARAQAKANKSPVWFYYYSYRANMSLSEDPANSTENFGVCHGDDVYLIFQNPYLDPTKTKSDMAMVDELVKIMTSIAKKGVPEMNYNWQKIDASKSSLNFLHIKGPGDLKMDSEENFSEKQFWSSINFNENKYNSAASLSSTLLLISFVSVISALVS